MERLRRGLLRWFEPWPEWVLRVATELMAVRLPRVRKRSILGVLKGVHWFVFEARIHGPLSPPPDLTLPPDIQHDLLNLFGHTQAHDEALAREIEALKADVQDAKLRNELDAMQARHERECRAVVDAFLNYLRVGFGWNLMRELAISVDASRATFDKEGRLRETTATPIYEKMLTEWPSVEAMSGPTALCRFLDPLLGKRDFENKLELVKKLCHRIDLVFRPACQGTSLPPPLVPPG